MRHTADSTAATTGRRTLTLPPQPIQVEAAPAPLPSDHLLQGRRTIEISHNGSVYRLQTTRLGKLILTK
ncbi:hemin uptake protein HemP [Ottowia sp.]|jgi:hemin uptake protein HemP|uniref:hemin uptake protein HemP n=1 Tax=Ottowia sp. TaxID=1898956 RepID=UPI0025D59269|nr:hemin uptake protein HemP [Ottowia sp.]MBK6615556.1 hemin uptake protein HemP [Ottowia sp.]MBK6746625.1 hemin uptake protein HemP [Ottowia sp.]